MVGGGIVKEDLLFGFGFGLLGPAAFLHRRHIQVAASGSRSRNI